MVASQITTPQIAPAAVPLVQRSAPSVVQPVIPATTQATCFRRTVSLTGRPRDCSRVQSQLSQSQTTTQTAQASVAGQPSRLETIRATAIVAASRGGKPARAPAAISSRPASNKRDPVIDLLG